jgi:hypothetical protein
VSLTISPTFSSLSRGILSLKLATAVHETYCLM